MASYTHFICMSSKQKNITFLRLILSHIFTCIVIFNPLTDGFEPSLVRFLNSNVLHFSLGVYNCTPQCWSDCTSGGCSDACCGSCPPVCRRVCRSDCPSRCCGKNAIIPQRRHAIPKPSRAVSRASRASRPSRAITKPSRVKLARGN